MARLFLCTGLSNRVAEMLEFPLRLGGLIPLASPDPAERIHAPPGRLYLHFRSAPREAPSSWQDRF